MEMTLRDLMSVSIPIFFCKHISAKCIIFNITANDIRECSNAFCGRYALVWLVGHNHIIAKVGEGTWHIDNLRLTVSTWAKVRVQGELERISLAHLDRAELEIWHRKLQEFMYVALLGIVVTYLAPSRISTRCVMKTVLNLFSDLHSCSWLWEFPKAEFLFWFDWIGRVFIPMYTIQKPACSNVTFNQSHEVSSLTAKDMHIHKKLAPKSFY